MPDWANDPYWSKYWNIAFQTGASMEYEEARARGDLQTMRFAETYYYPIGGGWYSNTANAPGGTVDQMRSNPAVYEFRADPTSSAAPVSTPRATPVAPQFDPKLEANALYGKPMALFAGGFARIGGGPAPIVGPYINGGTVDFVVSFGVPANPEGDRKIYAIWLDNELAWSSVSGGTSPGDGTFAGPTFDFVFKPGTLTQSAVSLESEKFPGDECAYRPQMILQIRNLAWQRFFDITGKPVPYVACDIGDTSDGAVPQDGINLGLALSRCAMSPWAGYTSANFEAVNITDVIGAILIKDNFNVVQLCQSVTGEYRNIDLLVSDKVWIKDRGSNVTPNFILDRDSIIGGDDALTVARANATAQRREHELVAIDPDQDYTAVPSLAKIPRDPMVISAAVGKNSRTIPLVIDAGTRQALAVFAQNYEENARRKLNFKIPALGYGIEPGDLFALTDIAPGFENEVFKVITTSHGANWIVDVEGEAILRCRVYGDDEGAGGAADEGGVFVSGDDRGTLRYVAVDGVTGTQAWQGLGGLDFSSNGSANASSYAVIDGEPTFLMGGFNDSSVTLPYGLIMASHDGLTWATVFTASVHQYIDQLVWSAAENMFFAKLGTQCLASPDGYVWSVHASEFIDHTEFGVADGHAGYDPVSGVRIAPSDLSLGFMVVQCVAFAGGLWMAGGTLTGGGSATATSTDGGATWTLVTSGAIGSSVNRPVVTMIAAPASDM